MVVSQNTPKDDGTMTAVLVLGSIGLGLAAALWCGMEATKAIFSTGYIHWPQYIRTLFAWNSIVVYGTKTPLPHPMAWHWLSVVVIGVVCLILFILSAWAMHLRTVHLPSGRRRSRNDNGSPDFPPGRWRDDPNNCRRDF